MIDLQDASFTAKSTKLFSQRTQSDCFAIFYKRHKGIDHTNNTMGNIVKTTPKE